MIVVSRAQTLPHGRVWSACVASVVPEECNYCVMYANCGQTLAQCFHSAVLARNIWYGTLQLLCLWEQLEEGRTPLNRELNYDGLFLHSSQQVKHSGQQTKTQRFAIARRQGNKDVFTSNKLKYGLSLFCFQGVAKRSRYVADDVFQAVSRHILHMGRSN